MKVLFLLGLLFVITKAQTNADLNKFVLFNLCEFCNGLVSHACCKLQGKCCPVYSPCRENLICSQKNNCEPSSCESGCCSLGNKECCALSAATILFAPMVGVVKTGNDTAAATSLEDN